MRDTETEIPEIESILFWVCSTTIDELLSSESSF